MLDLTLSDGKLKYEGDEEDCKPVVTEDTRYCICKSGISAAETCATASELRAYRRRKTRIAAILVPKKCETLDSNDSLGGEYRVPTFSLTPFPSPQSKLLEGPNSELRSVAASDANGDRQMTILLENLRSVSGE